jgi:hypothetical protein
LCVVMEPAKNLVISVDHHDDSEHDSQNEKP